MGRYYEGDISGKFWFAVQPSDDASFFGGTESEPNYMNYSFETEDLPTIEEGIAKCLTELGDNRAKLDAFFKEGGKGYGGYTDKMLAEELGFDWKDSEHKLQHPDVLHALEWYARLELGEKIKACVVETGFCNFEAEQ